MQGVRQTNSQDLRMEDKMIQHREPQDYMKRVMNKHEIEKAIRYTAGPRNFDSGIRKIWEQLIDRPSRRSAAKNTAASRASLTRRHVSRLIMAASDWVPPDAR